MLKLLRAVFLEYGLSWFFFRALYSLKIKALCHFPRLEGLFERRVQANRCFDFEPDLPALTQCLASLGESQKQELLHQAQDAIKGRIKAFSSLVYDYGDPINWHYSPLSKTSSPRDVKWFRLPDFDPVRGDVKAIWEASRLSHFILFARAYLLSGDARYYQAFSEQLAGWLEANPYSLGVHYKCGQEASLRMINALLAASVFRARGLLTQQDEHNLLDLAQRSYKKVLSNFFYAYRCVKNNHTITELCGMMLGAYCCRDTRRVKKAARLLEKVVSQQFYPDGGYIQYSFNYQRVAMQVMGCVFRFQQLTGTRPSALCRQRLQQSASLLYQCQSESGDLPNYGSNDGALFFPLTSCGYRDYRPTIGLVLAQTGQGSPYPPGPWDEELLWFGASLKRQVPEPARVSSAFDQIGLYTLRSGQLMLMVVLNRFASRPAHMDQLHLDVWFAGQNVLCDTGTFSYAEGPGRQLALTASHNTACMEGTEQMCRKGPFLLYNWPSTEREFFTNKKFFGTMRSRNAYVHSRKVEVNGAEVQIIDETSGTQSFCAYKFHTPCPVELQGNTALLSLPDGWRCRMEFSDPPTIIQANRSLRYLQLEAIACLQVEKTLRKGWDQNTVKMVFERTDAND